ncbi:hypothetical protein K469DRAFT_604823 [Zopfia rhizophila CBS 207.26]|uniref:Zn(2)-C6 fungal-type domain-containing protein n=1 Tax=Zopfia rhizophila CBS 207.26 TaxID=1314779 RepID=A0A6A6DDJ9_9PEZI|nr:hypothetical protein K469DRAFT_604823 [Zopfia rhizophila CBS 207.26]
MQACDRCHRRKSRCDKLQPCGPCGKANTACIYSDRTKERIFRAEHVERLERRLRHAEARNKVLASELARARAHADADETATPSDIGTVSGPSVQPLARSNAGDVITEVSYLSINAAGERQYLGSTSGILFANLVKAGVDLRPSSRQASPPFDLDDAYQHDHPYGHRSKDCSQELPPELLARKLVKAYLDHDHICYPFLSPSFILNAVDQVYVDASFYTSNSFEAFVFDMVLAIATANVYKFDWQMLPSAESHQARAMSAITDVLRCGGLQSLQAILLLCQYRTGSSIQDTSASMWHLVGIAARMSFELGLHREAAYPCNPPHSEDNADSARIFKDQEIRRRCFWCVAAMDRVVSNILGRPLAIREDDIDVNLPTPEDDRIFYAGLTEVDGTNNHARTHIFNHITTYRLLCGRIMISLHGQRSNGRTCADIYRLRDSLVADLDLWKQRTVGLQLPDVDLSITMSRDRSSFCSKEWYELIYHNAILMLYRPSPALSDVSRDPITLQRIFSSAKHAITLYAYLHRSRKINYSWITLQSLFMAGLSYIYAVGRHFRERRRSGPAQRSGMLERDPKTIEVVNDTRACSNVLVAVSERWNALRHCHEVFDRLSDAVLADSIKLECLLKHPETHQGEEVHAPHQPPEASGWSQATLMHTDISTEGLISQDQSAWGTNAFHISSHSGYQTGSPLAVDTVFRNCFDDLQHLYDQQQINNPVMQLSQDWLGYIGSYDPVLNSASSMETTIAGVPSNVG